jgi:DNA-binding NtrC family response regulator
VDGGRGGDRTTDSREREAAVFTERSGTEARAVWYLESSMSEAPPHRSAVIDAPTVREELRSALPQRAFEVEVVSLGKTSVHRIAPSTPGPLLVGQSISCHIPIADRLASRRHASLELVDGGLRFVDLGSTNGSFLGNTRITEVTLVGGERLRLGAAVLTVRVVSAAPSESTLSSRTTFGRVVGEAPAMRRLYPLLEKLASSKVPVVIEGETGTGKEVLAESLHSEGPLANGPYVVFDCTASPPSLIESELFGHERGAFTGATSRRKGVFELAHGGTLLIDEIGDLDLALQSKLLRAVERGEVRRVGGDQAIAVDVRIVAATRRNLDHELSCGRFRDDLFHRLAVARVELPPLRRRREDIGVLARLFWRQAGGTDEDFPSSELPAWLDQPWPGNVRQLRNVVSHRHAVGAMPLHVVDQDEESLDSVLALDLELPAARRIVHERLERAYVKRMLEKHGGNVTRAAEASGIALRHFHRIKARTQ